MREDKPVVTIYQASDGAWIVEVDTTFEPNNGDKLGGMRLYINDDLTYEGKLWWPTR